MPSTITTTSLADLPVRRGKVRDIYDLGDTLLLVSTDRISAFDWVLPSGIPDKGRVLTQLSRFWFERFQGCAEPHDFVRCERFRFAGGGRSQAARRAVDAGAQDERRADRVRGARISFRFRLEPSIRRSGTVCGIELPTGLKESDKLPGALFTPSTKAEQGLHDENISYDETCARVGADLAKQLSQRSIELYTRGAEYAASRGIIIADTKFEFGLVDDELILIDEVLTPDSSRFWPADKFQPGRGPALVRQAIRARLAHAKRLGQKQQAAGAAGTT